MDDKLHDPTIPSAPKCRRSIKSKMSKKSCYVNNNSHEEHMESETQPSFGQGQKSNSSENETFDDNIDHDKQMTESSSEQNEEVQSSQTRNRSRTISPERKFLTENFQYEKSSQPIEQNTNSFSYLLVLVFIIVAGILVRAFLLPSSKNEKQKQPINNPTSLLFESIENVKAKFYNQESDIWNDIASAINEVVSRNPKIPSIILLFANETATMDCLATDLAHASSTILDTDSLNLTPENFGDDAGEVINTLNKYSPPKKIVVIRDILSINAEAIKALHNLCDRINPLIKEAVYILTMQTKINYQSSQKKLAFVEEQIYRKLSKNIDHDILMALVTRITDGAIILVQPEPHIRYC